MDKVENLGQGNIIMFTYGKGIGLGYVTSLHVDKNLSEGKVIELLTSSTVKGWTKGAITKTSYPVLYKELQEYIPKYVDIFFYIDNRNVFIKLNIINIPITVDRMIEILDSKDIDAIEHLKEVIKANNG